MGDLVQEGGRHPAGSQCDMSNVHEGRMKICQNGRGHRCHGHHHGLGHKHRCLAMLVFIKPTVVGHVALWKKREGPILKFAAAEKSPFLHLRRCFFCSHQIKPTSTFQRFWGRGALSQRDKKRNKKRPPAEILNLMKSNAGPLTLRQRR